MSTFSARDDCLAVSHLNVVVPDIDQATRFYGEALGFEPAANADGPMDYPALDHPIFARNAGFDDAPLDLDIRFLRHPTIGLYLELFCYRLPEGRADIPTRETNDMGGVRHIALSVTDATAAYEHIKRIKARYAEDGLPVRILGQDHVPEIMAPFPYAFFYWIDPWGIQWEMEEGRPTGRIVAGITG